MPRTPPTSSPSNVIHRLQDCCSIPKAKTNSSNRIKAAVMAGATKAYYRRHNRQNRNQRRRVNKRQRRLTGMFLPCTPVPVGVYCWTEKQLLDQYCVVIDGSAVGNRTCITPKSCKRELKTISIQHGDLFVPKIPPLNSGLVYCSSGLSSTEGGSPYRLLPRRETLKQTHMLMSQ